MIWTPSLIPAAGLSRARDTLGCLSPRPVPAVVVATVCAFLIGVAVYLTLRSLALYGDGAHFLLRVVGSGSLYGPEPRTFVNAVHQAPLLLGLRLGITDMRSLALLLGLGQLVVPALIWAGALVLARASRFVFAMLTLAAGVCASTTWLFNVGEGTLAVPLAVLLAALLWRPNPWGPAHAALAIAAALVLVKSHESIVLASLVLCPWAAWRSVRSTGWAERWGCATVAALSAAACVGVATQRAEIADSPYAASLTRSILSLDPLALYVAAAASTLLLAAALVPPGRGRLGLFGLGLLAGSLAALILATPPNDVYGPYAARGGTALVAAAVAFALLLLWWRGLGWADVRGAPTGLVIAVPMALACALVATLIPRAERWSESLAAFRAQVAAAQGVVPVDRALPPNQREVVWGWTSASLSLVLRSSPESGVLVDAKPTYVPFLPRQARNQIDDKYTWRGFFP